MGCFARSRARRVADSSRHPKKLPLLFVRFGPETAISALEGHLRSPLASFSVAKYGPQDQVDEFFSDAGSGLQPYQTVITGNNPNDANVRSDVRFQAAGVQNILAQFGPANQGGVRYYTLEDEPGLWSDDVSRETQLLRNRSTRSLWDRD